MSHQLVASWRWFTENPSFDIIKLVEVRRIGDEFLVMSTPLQFVKFLTKTAITAVVLSWKGDWPKEGGKGWEKGGSYCPRRKTSGGGAVAKEANRHHLI